MAHRAAHDPAQHVAAALVRGQHAVGDQERRRAQMIGDDAQGGLLLALRIGSGQFGDGADQGYEQVDVVIVVLALQHGRDALQARASVDRRFRQRVADPRRDLLVLHEHEIPDLDEAVAIGLRRAGRATPDLVAVVVEDFRAGPARAGVAHLPEIVGARDADDPRFREACDLLPEIERLVVVDIDGGRELVLRQAEFLGHQFPRQFDRAILEIVAEREIAEHLEKRVMPRGVADIVEIVVLAAGAHAFLRGGGAHIGALLDTGEDVLELHHAGIGEHQRRVVARHQRRRRHDLVAVVGEEFEKCRPDLVNAAHVGPIAYRPGSPDARSSHHWSGRAQTGHMAQPLVLRRAAPLLDKGTALSRNCASRSGACRTSVKPLTDAAAALTALAGCVFLLSVQDSHVGRDRL